MTESLNKLSFRSTNGSIFGKNIYLGAELLGDPSTPNSIDLPYQEETQFLYAKRDQIISPAPIVTIDPNNYDNAGTISPVQIGFFGEFTPVSTILLFSKPKYPFLKPSSVIISPET